MAKPSSPSQLIDQSTRHAVYLERYKSSAINEYAKFLEKIEEKITAQLSKENITEWSIARLNKQLSVIRKTINEISSDINGLMREQAISLAEYESGYEMRSLDKVTVKYDFDLPSDTQLRSAVFGSPIQAEGPFQGQLLESFIDGWSPRTVKRFEGAVRLGFAQGRTTPQIVGDLFGKGRVADLSRRDLDSVVKTMLAHSANEARVATWAANADIIKHYRIVATLDDRTSSICRSLDGQQYKLGKGPMPPFHIRCRTTTVAVLDKRFSSLEKDGTRRSKDPVTGEIKSVSSGQTYYGWLKKQPAKVQDSIVGSTRGKLLRDGGLSAGRFAELQLGKRFEPLTLDEMRQLEPIAFHKAGLDD